MATKQNVLDTIIHNVKDKKYKFYVSFKQKFYSCDSIVTHTNRQERTTSCKCNKICSVRQCVFP